MKIGYAAPLPKHELLEHLRAMNHFVTDAAADEIERLRALEEQQMELQADERRAREEEASAASMADAHFRKHPHG